jgi:hypothetical protein
VIAQCAGLAFSATVELSAEDDRRKTLEGKKMNSIKTGQPATDIQNSNQRAWW